MNRDDSTRKVGKYKIMEDSRKKITRVFIATISGYELFAVFPWGYWGRQGAWEKAHREVHLATEGIDVSA